MNTEIWLEDLDQKYEPLKITGESAANFHVPNIGASVGAWQDEHTEGSDTYNLMRVEDVRHYVFKQANKTGLPIWVQEIHVMCSTNFSPPRRGR
jgi:hypothetical protein